LEDNTIGFFLARFVKGESVGNREGAGEPGSKKKKRARSEMEEDSPGIASAERKSSGEEAKEDRPLKQAKAKADLSYKPGSWRTKKA